MNRHQVYVAITGAQVSPEQVSLKELVGILSRLDRAIVSYAAAQQIDLSEDASVSLVHIESGSECLVFSVPDPLVGVVAGISKAVGERQYGELPAETYEELYALSQAVSLRGWDLEIKEDNARGIQYARFGAKEPLDAPYAPAFVKGTTTVYGQCLRVGGVHPKAELRLPSGKLMHVDLSEQVAKELATRLYEEVALEGAATWDTATWEILEFRVSQVTAFQKTDPVLAFKELAEAAHGAWDTVDAVDFVHGLRRDH